VAVWVLAALLAAALLVALVLLVLLRRAGSRSPGPEAAVAAAQAQVDEAVAAATAAHVEEIRRTLARERADSASLLAEEERRLAGQRSAALAEREQRIAERLADELAAVERRVDERLRTFADDLDRAQRHLEAQLARLDQRQRQAIAQVEARIEAEAAELGSTADEQRATILRLREELERAAGAAVGEALDELESQTVERRRAIEEITERLRAREAAIAEGIERAETDARGRLDVAFVEFERRQLERLDRQVGRETERHVQLAVAAFDERMREVREEAATRLARELDRAVELLAQQELARRLDG
jgi:hypothetical protein